MENKEHKKEIKQNTKIMSTNKNIKLSGNGLPSTSTMPKETNNSDGKKDSDREQRVKKRGKLDNSHQAEFCKKGAPSDIKEAKNDKIKLKVI